MHSLRFLIKPQGVASDPSTVQILGFNGTTLTFDPAKPYPTRCPLMPEGGAL